MRYCEARMLKQINFEEFRKELTEKGRKDAAFKLDCFGEVKLLIFIDNFKETE